MNVLYIGKYPPIQGGVSAQNYWRIKGLIKKYPELNYYILTNALEVETEYRIPFSSELLDEYNKYSNLRVFNTDPLSNPKFIPQYSPKSEKLLNLGIYLCKRFKFDVIESQYLLPYGYVAYLLSKMFNIPYILRHAGSDISRLLLNSSLHLVLKKVLKNSLKLITYSGMKKFFLNYVFNEEKIEEISDLRSVNLDYFTPNGKNLKEIIKINDEIFNIGFIGKPSKGKGIYQYLSILKGLLKNNKKVRGIVTCALKGKEIIKLKEIAENLKVSNEVIFIDFVYPWSMPKLYRSLDFVICPESDFSVTLHNTMIPRETIACGTPVSISQEIANKFPYYIDSENEIFIINNKIDLENSIKRINSIIEDLNYRSRIIEKGLKFSGNIEKFGKTIDDFFYILNETIKVE